jgi:hypothetical protein
MPEQTETPNQKGAWSLWLRVIRGLFSTSSSWRNVLLENYGPEVHGTVSELYVGTDSRQPIRLTHLNVQQSFSDHYLEYPAYYAEVLQFEDTYVATRAELMEYLEAERAIEKVLPKTLVMEFLGMEEALSRVFTKFRTLSFLIASIPLRPKNSVALWFGHNCESQDQMPNRLDARDPVTIETCSGCSYDCMYFNEEQPTHGEELKDECKGLGGSDSDG